MHTIFSKVQRGLVALCLIGMSTLVAPSGQVAAQKSRHLTISYIEPAPGYDISLCIQETWHLGFYVIDSETKKPLGKVAVYMTSGSSDSTAENGIALVPYKAEKAGDFTFKVTAMKTGYIMGSTVVKISVEDCGWNIRFWYEESVSAASEGNFFEATCWMKFDNHSFKRDSQNHLVLVEKGMITATYGCYPTGMDFPLYATMVPSVEGSLQIGFSGKYSDKNLLISLTAPGGVKPTDPMVNIQVVDAVQKKNVGPQIQWGMLPYIDVITQSGAGNWRTSNTIFDYKVFEAPKTLFWSEPLHFSGGTAYYIVERIKYR